MKPVRYMNVLVLVDPEQNGGEDSAPAVITAVLPDESVDVCVIPATPGSHYWLTGVELYETQERARASHSAGVLSAYPVRRLVRI
jgi:hypothetical protein